MPSHWLLKGALVVAAVGVVIVGLVFVPRQIWPARHSLLAGVPPPAGDPVPAVDTYASGRPADQLHQWALERAPALGIPVPALEAYAYAARVAEVENPQCHVAWTTLAGIGMVESHHGTYRGAQIAPNGDVSPPIRGVHLDGTNGNLKIMDDGLSMSGGSDKEQSTTTDRAPTPTASGQPSLSAESHQGTAEYARAMGPMQFIPQTWRLYGVDANNDMVISPDNFDDAALSAAGYLCFRGKDLATPEGWTQALRAYNHSYHYARMVRDWATAYAQR